MSNPKYKSLAELREESKLLYYRIKALKEAVQVWADLPVDEFYPSMREKISRLEKKLQNLYDRIDDITD